MIALWITYFLAAAVASGIFIAGGWRGRRARRFNKEPKLFDMPTDSLWAEDDIDDNAPDGEADVGSSIRLALRRLAPLMARQFVKVEIAAPAGLHASMKGAALTDLLEEVLASSIVGAPASRLLVTAAMFGNRISVCITDDMLSTSPTIRAGSERGLMERVALCGGALDVEVCPSEGKTTTLRLIGAHDERQETRDWALHETAQRSTVP